MALFAPQTFGRYLLLEKIATGGMAEVFKAKSFGVEGFEKLLVIKRILPHLSRNPRFVSMFINEAKIAVSLTHVNIAQVFHLGREGEDYFISMEYIHGRDLTQLLRRTRELAVPFPIPLAVYLAAEVARGLNYAHRTADAAGNPSPVIHRDISSQNVLISFEGEVKIVDFGIARLASQLEDGDKHQHLAGKVAYMSPEQAAGAPLDPRSDLFSLGSVLYELLTGQRLYQGQNLGQKVEIAREARFTPARELRPEIPEGLDALLRRLLSREPERRHQSAAELYEDLTELLFSEGIRVTAQDVATFMRELFSGELAQEAAAREVRSAVGSLDRFSRPGEEPAGGSRPLARRGSLEARGLAVSHPSSVVMFDHAEGGVKRPVVALMAEPLGLTDIGVTHGEERFLKVSLDLLKALTHLVAEHGGHVDRWLNERLWALWGLSRAGEHDVERALDCARALLEHMSTFNATHHTRLGMAVAVHRGQILVGAGSGEGALRYTALGDTLRLPERMLMEVGRGEVLVSEEIRASAQEAFHFEEGPALRTTWGPGRAASWRLTGIRALRERHVRPSAPARDPWIPRGRELEIARDAVTLLKQGEGQVLHVVGEAGVGKSRFLDELGRMVPRREIGWITGHCLYRHRETPMAVFRDMLSAGARIDPVDPPGVRWEKLGRLAELGLSPLDLSLIGELLGLGSGGAEGGAERREGLFRAIRKVLRGLTRDRPALLAVENLQWMDPLSLEFAQELVESPPSAHLLLVFTYRPELKPPWSTLPGVTEIPMARLEMDGTAAFIRAKLRLDPVPAQLTEGLYLRSDGNPLHLEQLLKVLQESGRIKVEGGRLTHLQLERGPAVPFTLQGLIASRIDALEEADRALLHAAAVCGRQAALGVVARVSGRDPSTIDVQALVDRGLIDVAGEDGRIRFQNHLTWEATYQSLSPRTRRGLHRKVAQVMEALYADAADPEDLYHHLMEGGLRGQAARYAEMAADRYQSKYFIQKALDFCHKAIELLHEQDDLSEAGALPQLGALYVKLGRLQSLTGDRQEAQTSFERGLDVASELEDARLEAILLGELGKLKAEMGEAFVAQNFLELALENATALREPALQAEILESLGSFYLSRGSLAQARETLERGLEVAERVGAPQLVGQILIRLGDLGLREGDWPSALERNQLCMLLAQDAGDRILLGRALNNIGAAYMAMGNFDAALECYRRSIDVRKGLGYMRGMIVNYHNIGELFFRQSKLGRAYAYFQESRNLAREYRWPSVLALNTLYMSYIEAMQGDAAGLTRLRETEEEARAAQQREVVATGRYLTALYHLSKGARDEAQRAAAEALELAQAAHVRLLEVPLRKMLEELAGG